MCLSPYVSSCPPSYRSVYADLCRALRRDACLHLNSDLCLDLNSRLYTELNREKFEKSYQELFRKSFASLFGLKYRRLQGSSYLAPYRQILPGGRSVGRPLGGRIVFGNQETTTYGRWLAPVSRRGDGTLKA